jgi:hypothetical protein
MVPVMNELLAALGPHVILCHNGENWIAARLDNDDPRSAFTFVRPAGAELVFQIDGMFSPCATGITPEEALRGLCEKLSLPQPA